MVAGQIKYGFFLSIASSFIPTLKQFGTGFGGSYKSKSGRIFLFVAS